jgi:hypothetical protein
MACLTLNISLFSRNRVRTLKFVGVVWLVLGILLSLTDFLKPSAQVANILVFIEV